MKELFFQKYIDNTANKLPLKERLPKLPANVGVSVVVPAYNEESYIENLLVCLNLQNLGQKFELVIVNNGSSDKTTEIIRSFTPKLLTEIFVVNEEKKGAGNARKTGIDEIVRRVVERDQDKINRHYIALTDADTQPDTNWLSKMYTQMSSNNQSLLVSGNYLASPEIDVRVKEEVGIKNYFSSFARLSDFLDKVVGQTRMRGPNSGFEIECYVAAGGFRQPLDTNGNTAPRECFDLAERIARTGAPIEHFNHPVIASQRRKLSDLISQVSSYDVVDENTGRFLSTRSSEKELLDTAISKIPPAKWREYQERILTRIVRNTLLFPMASGIKRDIPNTFGLEFWGKLVEDSKNLDIDSLSEKWGVVLVKELLKRITF